MPDTPSRDRAVTAAAPADPLTPTAVLAPITLVGSDSGDAVIESIEAAGAGATGIELSILDARLALERGVAAADALAEASGLRVFIRTDGPLSPGPHRRICPAGNPSDTRRSTAPCVVDLGIDRLGLAPDDHQLASYWPADLDPVAAPFMISTLGFGSVADAEVMGLAALAAMRGAAAITTDRTRSVRRVVDTVVAVLEAKGAA